MEATLWRGIIGAWCGGTGEWKRFRWLRLLEYSLPVLKEFLLEKKRWVLRGAVQPASLSSSQYCNVKLWSIKKQLQKHLNPFHSNFWIPAFT
jgi:hypothetical protein